MSCRRLVPLVGLSVIAFATVSIADVSGASAEPPGGDPAIKIDCQLGGGWVDPGTMNGLPAAVRSDHYRV